MVVRGGAPIPARCDSLRRVDLPRSPVVIVSGCRNTHTYIIGEREVPGTPSSTPTKRVSLVEVTYSSSLDMYAYHPPCKYSAGELRSTVLEGHSTPSHTPTSLDRHPQPASRPPSHLNNSGAHERPFEASGETWDVPPSH